MIRNLMTLLLVTFTLAAGCKTDDEATADPADPSAEQPAQTTGSAGEETGDETDETTGEELADGTFGALVDGATTVTVNQRSEDGSPGADHAVDDADWIAKFVTAVGPDTTGSDGVPRCVPNYTLKFAGEEGELATFGAVCSGSDTAILVHDGKAYTAADPATVLEMLQAFVPEGAE